MSRIAQIELYPLLTKMAAVMSKSLPRKGWQACLTSKSFLNSLDSSPDALLSSLFLLHFGVLSVGFSRGRFAWTRASSLERLRSRLLARMRAIVAIVRIRHRCVGGRASGSGGENPSVRCFRVALE